MIKRECITSIELRDIFMDHEGKLFFEGLNFVLPVGKTIIIDGAPGCGKSVLLKVLGGLIEPSRGDVIFNGKPIGPMSYEEFDLMRLNTAFAFDNGGLLSNRTLMDNITLPHAYHGNWGDEAKAYVRELIEAFSLEPFLSARPAGVSAGIRKIAGLVRALALQPQILFLDEPTVGIGNEALHQLNQWIKRQQERNPDMTLVITSSDREFMAKTPHICHHIRGKKLVPATQIVAGKAA